MGAGGEALGNFFGLCLSSVWKMPFVDRDGTTKRALCSFTEKSIPPGPLPLVRACIEMALSILASLWVVCEIFSKSYFIPPLFTVISSRTVCNVAYSTVRAIQCIVLR